MFNFFKRKPPTCPVDDKTQEWIQHSLFWLCEEFGMETLQKKKVLVPSQEDFPIIYDGSHQTAFDTLKIVAVQMEVKLSEIELEFYSEGISEIGAGGIGGRKVFIKHEKDANKSSGKYHGKNDDGKFHISIEEKNLNDPEGLVATLAHEIAHIKLLGEDRMDANNEHLTDLTTVIYGLGVFNANAAFRFHTGFDKWGYRSIGYLNQIEWGYALAAYSALKEDTSPQWANFLSPTVKGAFERSTKFIIAARDSIKK